MIKGAQKQMIVVKTSSSRYFEEAYFVLKNDATKKRNRTDLLTEANRILKESENVRTGKKKHRSPVLWFGIGVLLGVGIAGLLILLV